MLFDDTICSVVSVLDMFCWQTTMLGIVSGAMLGIVSGAMLFDVKVPNVMMFQHVTIFNACLCY